MPIQEVLDAATLDPQTRELSSPTALCEVLGIEPEVYDEVVKRWSNAAAGDDRGAPKPGSAQARMLAALEVAGDTRFDKDEEVPAHDEREKRRRLATQVAGDTLALRVVADTVYQSASTAHGVHGVYHVCRALALGLRTIERDAARATEANWTPPDESHTLDEPVLERDDNIGRRK